MSFQMRDFIKTIIIQKIHNIYSENVYKRVDIDSKPFFPNYLDNNTNIPLTECYSCAIFKKNSNKLICIISVVIDSNYNVYMKSGPNLNNTKIITPFSCLSSVNINNNIEKLFWFNNTNIINYINNMINISNTDIDTLDLFINDTLNMMSNIPVNTQSQIENPTNPPQAPSFISTPLYPQNEDEEGEPIPSLEVEPDPSPEPSAEPVDSNYLNDGNSETEDEYTDMPKLLDEHDQLIDPEGLKGPIYNKYYKNCADTSIFTTNKVKKNRFKTMEDALTEAQQLFNNNYYNDLCITRDWKGWCIRTGPIWVNSSSKQKKISDLDLTHITYQLVN